MKYIQKACPALDNVHVFPQNFPGGDAQNFGVCKVYVKNSSFQIYSHDSFIQLIQ